MALVHSCSEMSQDERDRFLDSACDGDAELRREVEILLAEGNEATGGQIVEHHLARALPDHYRLIGIIGSGGMADVFLAEDDRLSRRVAIKFLNETFRRDPERMKRFKQEARSASALNHPNIITIHDVGESDGVQYIVSEFVEGETLGTRLGRGPLPVEEALDIAIQITSALNAAHQSGIIHRDLKPDNIMLRRDGSVKVVDFGIAKASAIYGAGDDQSDTAVSTSPGLILGTPKYMSPEQTRGIRLDARTDIFSFGIVLFEMVSGHSPFGGSSAADVIAGIIGREPRDISKYVKDPPARLVRIIRKALTKQKEGRYQSAGQMLEDLRDLRSDLVVSTRDDAEVVATNDTRTAAKRVGMWLGAAVIVLLLATGLWLAFFRSPGVVTTAAAMRTVQITSWSSASAEAVAAASFSPDAKMVAFASTKTGAMEIWVKPTVGGDPIQVTKNGFYNQYPVWSPDGQELAFFSSRGDTRGIWRVSFTGGQETQVVTAGPAAKPIRWAKDRIFFTDADEVFSCNISSHERRQETNLVDQGIRARAINVSADGMSLAISVRVDSVWKVQTKRMGGEAFTDIAISKDQVDSVAFDPDGRTVFYSGGAEGVIQVFKAAPGGSSPEQISTGTSDLVLQDISLDGSKVLCGTINEASDLWSVDLQGFRQNIVANDIPEEYWAKFSPDGKSVAYQSVTQADRPFRGSILVKSLAASTPAVLISQEGFLPKWSPDGEWIAFFRRSGPGMSIWVVRPSGADLTKLVDGTIATPGYMTVPYLKAGGAMLSWSGDSKSLSFVMREDAKWNIWNVSIDAGRNPECLTRNLEQNEAYTGIETIPSGKLTLASSELASGAPGSTVSRLWLFSPGADGRLLFETRETIRLLGVVSGNEEALVAATAGSKDTASTLPSIQLFAVSLNGGGTRKLNPISGAYFHNISLSGDGKQIAFVTRSKGVSEIWTVSVSGGQPRRVLLENDPKVLISSLEWSPDGRSLIFGRQNRTNVLSMLTN